MMPCTRTGGPCENNNNTLLAAYENHSFGYGCETATTLFFDLCDLTGPTQPCPETCGQCTEPTNPPPPETLPGCRDFGICNCPEGLVTQYLFDSQGCVFSCRYVCNAPLSQSSPSLPVFDRVMRSHVGDVDEEVAMCQLTSPRCVFWPVCSQLLLPATM